MHLASWLFLSEDGGESAQRMHNAPNNDSDLAAIHARLAPLSFQERPLCAARLYPLAEDAARCVPRMARVSYRRLIKPEGPVSAGTMHHKCRKSAMNVRMRSAPRRKRRINSRDERTDSADVPLGGRGGGGGEARRARSFRSPWRSRDDDAIGGISRARAGIARGDGKQRERGREMDIETIARDVRTMARYAK